MQILAFICLGITGIIVYSLGIQFAYLEGGFLGGVLAFLLPPLTIIFAPFVMAFVYNFYSL